MVDDLKNRGDRILKNILSGLQSSLQSDDDSTARDLVFGLLSKAGRSKDEVIQILGREIGLALAAVLAKPLEQITENKRVRITVELVPKAATKGAKSSTKKHVKTKQTLKKTP
jgi:hypothetical protein